MIKTSKKIKILFCMEQVIMGGREKVLCQYLLALKSLPNVTLSVVSKKKVTEPYFLDFFKKNNIQLIDNFIDLRGKFLFIKLGKKRRDKINEFINGIKWFALKLKNDVFIDFTNFLFKDEFKKIEKRKFVWCHVSILFFNEHCKDKLKEGIYDKIICLSESFKKDFIELYSEFSKKVDFIYNPIDIAEAQKLAAKDLSIKVNSPYFIAVQRLDIDKDVATIIKAFQQYSQIDKDTKLYIVGDGPNRKELEQLALGNENIIFTGQLDNPYPLIKNAKALILSSTKKIGEGFGLVLVEAQALETLAISSDVKSGVREILLDGQAGFLFEAENPESLAEKLVYVKEHTDECQQMVQTAAENLNRFSVENAVKKFIKLCDVEEEIANV